MRWVLRIIVALTLSASAVALLTWAGRPRPRFVVPLPAMGKSAVVTTRPDLLNYVDDGLVDRGPRRTRSRTPWVGFRIMPDAVRVCGGAFWFVNVQDGRTAGPWEIPPAKIFLHAWDYRGAAIVCGFADGDGSCVFGRFDPESGRYAVFATDRDMDFLVSANGETLLTFLVLDQGTLCGSACSPKLTV